jgi:Na+-driven multidrug efflux pump
LLCGRARPLGALPPTSRAAAAAAESAAADADAADASARSSRLDGEIFRIALPALATLAADPLAGLVSTAWVGQMMGASQLAAVGIALSLYGSITKLLSMPLLAVVTSATATAKGRGGGQESEAVAAAASAALALAAAVGVVQILALGGLGLGGLGLWGAGPGSPLHADAASYLGMRALGAPAAVLFLALQGTFRGLGDTRCPLVATLVCTAVNVALEPLFIFRFGWAVRGAAAAIVAAQALPCAGLLRVLSGRVALRAAGVAALAGAGPHLRATGLLVLRT